MRCRFWLELCQPFHAKLFPLSLSDAITIHIVPIVPTCIGNYSPGPTCPTLLDSPPNAGNTATPTPQSDGSHRNIKARKFPIPVRFALRREFRGTFLPMVLTGYSSGDCCHKTGKDSEMSHSHASTEMQRCIEDCQTCASICLSMAANHCLKEGGKHVEPIHYRTMLDCVEVCQTAANFMLRNSSLHSYLCRACSAVCAECARSCDEVGGMDECADACKRCAASCQAMTHNV